MSKNTAFSFAVLSGKGGVGKSNLALTICHALHLMGQRTLLIDCDMGLPNMDVLLGIAPQAYLQDVLLSNRDPAEVLVPVGETPGFDLLPSNSGMAELLELDSGARNALREKLVPLTERYGYICMDVGAGISSTALWFADMASIRVVVITPEPTSLTDSYAMMKVLSTKHNAKEFFIIVNQIESQAEARQTYDRISTVCQRFLGFSPTLLGTVRSDRVLVDAVRKQKPLMQFAPMAPAATDCTAIAHALHRLRGDLSKQGKLPPPLGPMTVHG